MGCQAGPVVFRNTRIIRANGGEQQGYSVILAFFLVAVIFVPRSSSRRRRHSRAVMNQQLICNLVPFFRAKSSTNFSQTRSFRRIITSVSPAARSPSNAPLSRHLGNGRRSNVWLASQLIRAFQPCWVALFVILLLLPANVGYFLSRPYWDFAL